MQGTANLKVQFNVRVSPFVSLIFLHSPSVCGDRMFFESTRSCCLGIKCMIFYSWREKD